MNSNLLNVVCAAMVGRGQGSLPWALRTLIVPLKKCLFMAVAVQAAVAPRVARAEAPTDRSPIPDRGLQQESEALTVLAAASLADVLPAVARAWEAEGGGAIRFSFDATSRLAPQILRGAPADVFISADGAWMDWLSERGGVDPASITSIVRNRLAFVVPSGHPSPPGGAGELQDSGLRRIALAGEDVPAGRYARTALELAGAWGDVEGRIVRGGSVRGALEWVARGEADGGVVYQTDALAESRVQIAFVFPEQGYPAVVYPGGVTTRTRRPAEARAFLDFLRGPEARATFTRAGFGVEVLETAPQLQAPPSPLEPWSAVRLSLMVALGAVLLGLVPAIGAGWILARKDFRGKTLLSMLLMAPLVIPPVVTGFLLLSVLGRQSAIGGVLDALGLPVPFTLLGAVIAALVVGFPLYVMAIRGAFDTVDRRYEEVSWTLGVPRVPTFRRISLPLALPGIAAGAVLAFARALGEFGATVVLAGNLEGETRTIALAVYSLLESPTGRGATWTLVVASVALSMIALLGFEALSRWQRRRLEDHHGR